MAGLSFKKITIPKKPIDSPSELSLKTVEQKGDLLHGDGFTLQRSPSDKSSNGLGSGGFGTVFAVYNPKTLHAFAVKEVSLQSAPPDLLDSVVGEAVRLNASQSPICAYQVLHDNSSAFIVMQLGACNLHALQPKLKQQHNVIKSALLRKWVYELAQQLTRFHDVGTYHHDIKPPNIMLSNAGEAGLVDFGAAQTTDELRNCYSSAESDMCVTLDYASPERLSFLINRITMRFDGDEPKPENYDKTDIFSLGVSILEVAVGNNPFREVGQDIQRKACGRADLKGVESVPGPFLRAHQCFRDTLDCENGQINPHLWPKEQVRVFFEAISSMKSIDAKLAELVLAMLKFEPSDRPAAHKILEQAHKLMIETTRDTQSKAQQWLKKHVKKKLRAIFKTLPPPAATKSILF